MIRIRIRQHGDPLFRILVFNRESALGDTGMVGGVHTLKGLKRVIVDKLGLPSLSLDELDKKMILHLVQPSSANKSSKRLDQHDPVIGNTETVGNNTEMLCRIESLDEVMPDDCIEILTL